MEDNLMDDFDLSSLIGMSTLVNKDESNNQINAKEVEKDLIAQLLSEDCITTSNDNYVENDEVETPQCDMSDPIDEYNSIIKTHLESIDTNSPIAEDPIYNTTSNFNTGDSMTLSSMDTYDMAPNINIGFLSETPDVDDSDDHDMYKPLALNSQCTEEHSNQKYVDGIFKYQGGNDSNYNLLDENTADMKITLLEKIDNLKEELEDDGISVDKIPRVDTGSSLEEIEYTAKLLMLKVNRNRYSNMGEEFILAFAHGLEIACDGKRKFFGLQPDLTNCSDIVKVKLRRVKNETSQLVSNVVEKYEISPMMRILIELVPSIFLHSRRRSLQTSQWDISDDIEEIRKF